MSNSVAKTNMIKQQIHTWNVLDSSTLTLIDKVPREFFVPETYKAMAFADFMVPLDHDQVMMVPQVEARLLQALAIEKTDKVLEIGTGSGYFTALLAGAAQHVYSLDIFPEFLTTARKKLDALNINNVTLQEGNAAEGWDKQQPYDAICMTGSLPHLSDIVLKQLKPGGRLCAIVGREPAMEAVLVTRTDDANWTRETLFETSLPPLLQTEQQAPFKF